VAGSLESYLGGRRHSTFECSQPFHGKAPANAQSAIFLHPTSPRRHGQSRLMTPTIFVDQPSKGARRPSQCIERGAYSSPYTSAPTNAYQVRICFSTAASRRAFAERWPSCRDPLASSTPGPVPVFRPMSRRALPAADRRVRPRCLESCLA